ncbi:MAG: 3'-5' exonuclease [Lentisphaeria bacterium]|nr:3'-5' exonuclease [Lentisphaeria bacterium]NQZ69286.1 3'-5' exonuclease [Lentisphaeria bacterium]
MLAREAEFVVIDFETTGVIDEQKAEPWQIGMVFFSRGSVNTEFSYNKFLQIEKTRAFNPSAPGSWHKYRDELAESPRLIDLWTEIKSWWLDRTLVAHNISVEKNIMEDAAPLHRYGPWIDTLKLARIAYPYMDSHKLEDLIYNLQLSERLDALCPDLKAHDAYYDAVAAGLLLEHMLSQESWQDLTIEQLVHSKPERYYKK